MHEAFAFTLFRLIWWVSRWSVALGPHGTRPDKRLNDSTGLPFSNSQLKLLKLKGNWIARLLRFLSCKWPSHIIWCKTLSICIGISLESANRSPECGAKIWEFTQRVCAFRGGWCARADRVQSVQKGETWDMSEGCVGYLRLYNSDQRCPWCGPAVHGVCLWSLSEALEEISQLLQVASVALSRIWKCFGLRPSLSSSFEV